MRRLRFALALAVAVVSALLAVYASHPEFPAYRVSAVPQAPPAPKVFLTASPAPVYSQNPDDSWNRVFYYLFSRRFEAYLSSEFPDAGPMQPFEMMMPVENRPQMSARTFMRDEIGDRAIDPLYPAFLSDAGARLVLTEPAYSAFHNALSDALRDDTPRSTIARAIMQNDLWSAYDVFYRYRFYKENGDTDLAERRLVVLDLLARGIRRIALTPGEIRALPANYAAARSAYSLPDLFGKNGGWVEFRWLPERIHDEAVDFRRVTRIFLEPAKPPRNMQEFLNRFRSEDQDIAATLSGVALVTQPLLIDTQGRLEPANFFTDVQVRLFHRTPQGAPAKADIQVAELSRKQWIAAPESAGFVAESEDDPAYAPTAGNDYAFASIFDTKSGPSAPAVVKLRSRCVSCHGSQDLTNVMTFDMIVPPDEGKGPPVRQLNPAKHESADFVISQKLKSEDWIALRQAWENAPSAAPGR
jgi:hypothetical protein